MNGHFEDNGNVWLQNSCTEPGEFIRFERHEDGTFYHAETPMEVRKILSAELKARNYRRIRVFYGDHATGKDWCEEDDVCGFVGRSMGLVKMPLLLPTRGSSGGDAILDDCIVRILINGCEVYRTKNYQEPVFEKHVKFDTDCVKLPDGRKLPYEVSVNGQTHACFETLKKRQRWLDFMTGKRMSK